MRKREVVRSIELMLGDRYDVISGLIWMGIGQESGGVMGAVWFPTRRFWDLGAKAGVFHVSYSAEPGVLGEKAASGKSRRLKSTDAADIHKRCSLRCNHSIFPSPFLNLSSSK